MPGLPNEMKEPDSFCWDCGEPYPRSGCVQRLRGRALMQPVEGLGAGTDQVVALVRQQPQHSEVILGADLVQAAGMQRGVANGDRIAGVGLAAVAG
jgi:hypothetical protein